jgi:manganese catalase
VNERLDELNDALGPLSGQMELVCQPHIKRGDHLRLYRFSPSDFQELAAVFNGTHPETGEGLVVIDEAPEGVPPRDLPAQTAVFAPDYAPEEIAEIARKLRERAGLGKEPTGIVANGSTTKAKPRPMAAAGARRS